MVTTTTRSRDIVAAVVDPELPFLTIEDLGILRDVDVDGDRTVVAITPTYSGCPAMEAICADILGALASHGITDVEVVTRRNPAWTTADITPDGHRKLAAHGIAPPDRDPTCPRCAAGSPRTLSFFGSTACKALMVCTSCGEPFDNFKTL